MYGEIVDTAYDKILDVFVWFLFWPLIDVYFCHAQLAVDITSKARASRPLRSEQLRS